MKKKENSESITSQISFLQNSLITLQTETEITNAEKSVIISECLKVISDVFLFLRGLKKFISILVAILVTLAILFIISLFFERKADIVIKEIEKNNNNPIIDQILESKKVVSSDSTITTSYNYLTRNNKIVSYNQLIKEKDSIENLKQVNSIKLQMLDIKLQMAKDVYGINFKETKSEISINSQKIDSALILLENYRKNIFYNNSTSKWEIIENKK